ncbi:YkgJ family cysteine cluster protein [Halopenitus salinus]|uniref:YkgJ family cysteine cluster protein n=1 Tax=Halopenitus salinus TaxID=1198295 RepID=A0ABD5UT72_9EURY
MEDLEAELERARDLEIDALADAIESIGFECTRCGACCKGYYPDEEDPAETETADGSDDGIDGDAGGTATEDGIASDADTRDGGAGETDREPHTATVFPDEVRDLIEAANGDDLEGEVAEKEYDWRDVARPMPYGLSEDADGNPVGETFEWALQTDACGDCTFYREADGRGRCTVHDDRPLVCRTYPFSVALGGTSQPMGEAVDGSGMVRAHECEGLGRDIERADAESLAAALKRRAVRELEESIAVRDAYDPTVRAGTHGDGHDENDGGNDGEPRDVVVFDSEGPKRGDGTPIE